MTVRSFANESPDPPIYKLRPSLGVAVHGQPVLGAKALTEYAGRFYSPVYGYCEWTTGLATASCAIGCTQVPGDRHQGCGFHAFWEIPEAREFISHIRGTRSVIVLMAGSGDVALHLGGYRSLHAELVGVLDWDARELFGYDASEPGADGRQRLAASYFGVPLLEEPIMQAMIGQALQPFLEEE